MSGKSYSSISSPCTAIISEKENSIWSSSKTWHLFCIAAGQMAALPDKSPRAVTHIVYNPGCNAIEALGQTGASHPLAYICSMQLHWSQVPDKSWNSWGRGTSTLIHRFRGHATALTHQSLSRCHSIHHQPLLPDISGKKQLFRDWRNLKQKLQQWQPKPQSVTYTVSDKEDSKISPTCHPQKKWALRILSALRRTLP